ncbi:cullin adaptor [Acrasis kona]|uniref:Cullin adaptor n=1 Tax=Acrasis kona TaxID=1008807 RepID=A0AAW2ZMJ1_9EUKA
MPSSDSLVGNEDINNENIAEMEKAHMDELMQDMLRLLTQPVLSDFILVVGEKKLQTKFEVHRSILAARCQYFYGLFHSNMDDSKAKEISFPQHNPSDWRVLLDYFYTSKITINHENAFGVLKLSDEFGVLRVKEHCVNYVRQLVTDENVLDVFEESRHHNFIELYAFCKCYIEENARRVFFVENFIKLPKDSLKELLHSDKIQLAEIEIFVAVINWGKYSLQNNSSGKNSSREGVLTEKPKRTTSSAISKFFPISLGSSPNSNSQLPDQSNPSATAQTNEDAQANTNKRLSTSEAPPLTPVIRGRPRSRSEHADEHSAPSHSEMSHDSDSEDDEPQQEDQHHEPPPAPPQVLLNLRRATQISESEENDPDHTAPASPPSSSSSTTPNTLQQPWMNDKRLQDILSTLYDYVGDKNFVKKLAAHLSDVMPLIRFGILNPNEVYDYVEPSLVVSHDLLLEAYRSHALSDRIEVQESSRLKVREGSLFYAAGVLENVPLKLLRGWTCIYNKPYSDKTTDQVFRTAIASSNNTATRILVAAKHKNSNTLALAAMGRINVVLKETNDSSTFNKENSVYWYHWKNHSFGFSDTRNINLGTADLLDGKFKLSWHLTGRGGYRVGDIKNLNESKEWEKLLFTS